MTTNNTFTMKQFNTYKDKELFKTALTFINDYKTTTTPADELYPVIDSLFEESRRRCHKPRCTKKNVLISDMLDVYSQYLYHVTRGNSAQAYTVLGWLESWIDQYNRKYAC